MPDAAGDIDRPESLRHGHKVDLCSKKKIDGTGHRKKDTYDTAKYDNRYEVRHIQNQLNLFLDTYALNSVQQKCQNDRNRESPEQAVNTQFQSISQIAEEIRRFQKPLEVFESDPFASPDSFDRIIVLERDQDTAHRDIPEYDGQNHGRKNKDQIQLPMLS